MDTNHHSDLNPAPSGFALSGKVMLIATVALFSVVLLLLFVHLYLRSRLLIDRRRHRRLRRRLQRRLAFAVNGAVGSITSFSSRRGLDPAVLKSLAVQVFTAGSVAAGREEDEKGVECAVCLNEFEDGEKLRALPRCGHRFHIDCIDMWFHSHATCPLCRTTVEAPPPLPRATASPAMPPVPSLPEPGRPSPPDLCWGEGGVGSSASSSEPRGLGIEVPGRGSSEGELGLGLKSPRNPMLMLTRLLIRDSRHNRAGGAAAGEADLERGEGAASGAPHTPR